jgi:CheY-like chemotaxis protein
MTARILVVEDQLDVAESMRILLELLGHEVRVASTGPDGLDKTRRCYDPAVQSMERHEPNHADLSRFQIEAAELLQIQEEKTRPQRTPTENEME